MRVGILTFHNSRNYGAVMQAYALVQIFTKLGHNAEVIDYRCRQIEAELDANSNSKNILKRIFYWKKRKEFEAFNERFLCLSKEKNISIDKISNVLAQYDLIVVGSDQVWNKKITDSDNTYFLDNVKVRKVSYAASCGDLIDLNEKDILMLRSFNAISVRELLLNEVIKSSGLKSSVTCDPTILAGREVFERFNIKKLTHHKYIFVFMIWKSNKLLNSAKIYAKANGLKVITNKDCVKFLFHSKPADFVSWVANAECVFTNSFHGTVFSLLFQKPFLSSIDKPKGDTNTRIEELLTRLGCQQNIWDEENEYVNLIKLPDYVSVNRKMKEMQDCAMEFINTSLKS